MQTIILCCFYGILCVMGLLASVSGSVTRDTMMRRGGRLAPPTEM
jgi:hypothetical protein